MLVDRHHRDIRNVRSCLLVEDANHGDVRFVGLVDFGQIIEKVPIKPPHATSRQCYRTAQINHGLNNIHMTTCTLLRSNFVGHSLELHYFEYNTFVRLCVRKYFLVVWDLSKVAGDQAIKLWLGCTRAKSHT